MVEKVEKGGEERICNCRNSKCMKLYCECFSAGLECNKSCRCTDCRNQKDSESIKMYRNIASGQPNKTPKAEGVKESKGCSCRKSFCVKKYCECFQDGLLCNENCKCIECQNNESLANKSVLNNLKKNQSSSTNKNASLYPIILSQSADHIHHIMSEENIMSFQEKQIEQGISDLFKGVEQVKPENILESFINLLKRLDSKMTKCDSQAKEEQECG